MPRPQVHPALVHAPSEDGYAAYLPGGERVYRLNAVAALLLELSDGARTVEEIEEIAAPLLPADRRDSIRAWLAQAIRDGILLDADAGPAPPFDTDALSSLSAELRNNGSILPAFLCQYRAVELSPDDPEKLEALGELAHILGRREDARQAYERLLELRPGDAETRHILTALRGETPPDRAPDDTILALYRRFSAFYETNLVDDLDYQAPRRLAQRIVRALDGRRGLRTLDMGCGTGLAGVELRPLSSRLVGVDLSPEMVALARARNIYDRLEVSELTAWLAACDERFDLAAASDTLIYFGDLRPVLAAAARLLAPSGLLAFTVERARRPPYRLTDNGRFEHHADHVREAAELAGLGVLSLDEDYLRMEYGEEVTGLFTVLRRP